LKPGGTGAPASFTFTTIDRIILGMNFSHREEERDGRLLDVLADEVRGLRIVVSRLGAEVVSLARRDAKGQWLGFLYRDNDIGKPSKGWGNHATVMGYYLHRLKNERSLYRGKEIRGGTHSFLRHKIFSDVRTELGTQEASLTYRITPDEIEAVEYPLKVSLALTYQLREGSLAVQFHFQNQETELAAHLQFGLHPGFAATSFDTFQLEMPPGRYRRWLAPGNFLSGETEEIDHAGGEMPFDRSLLSGSYIVEFVEVAKRVFVYRDPASRRQVTLDFTDVPYFTLWSDGGPFLCIEPCWGLTDRHQQRPFEEKDGIQCIPPGGELTAGFNLQAVRTELV
jgi:galactose mutarotase-like enzyme